MKRIYLVRHCQASGQEPTAQLTEDGFRQSSALGEWFRDKNIEYILSSPYLRAVDTVKPLSEFIKMEIHTDDRLRERVLSSTPLENWLNRLEETYRDFDLKFEGGESANEAVERGLRVIEEMKERPERTILIVTHGALLSLLIKQYDPDFGFEDWKRLSNPDVYELEIQDNRSAISRVWKANGVS